MNQRATKLARLQQIEAKYSTEQGASEAERQEAQALCTELYGNNLPKPNEFWVTKSGNTVLIVVINEPHYFISTYLPECKDVPNLGMLWWDMIDEEWQVSPILDRLERLATADEVLNFVSLLSNQRLNG